MSRRRRYLCLGVLLVHSAVLAYLARQNPSADDGPVALVEMTFGFLTLGGLYRSDRATRRRTNAVNRVGLSRRESTNTVDRRTGG